MPESETTLDVYKAWLGIPEGPRPPDHYALLRLPQFDDDPERAQNNYRKLNALVRKYASGPHSVRSQELLNELAMAMLCLTDPERKREYDQSLGREFDEVADQGDLTLGEILVAEGHITKEQCAEAESFAEARGLSMRDAVVQMKLVDTQQATQALAQELKRSFVNLEEMTPADSALDRVPRSVVKRHSILPLFVDDDAVLVACVHEPSPDLEEEIRMRFDRPMRAVMAIPRAVDQAIAKYYAAGTRDDSVAEQSTSSKKKAAKGKEPKKSAKQKPAAKEPARRLTEEERAERKKIGWLLMCWGVIIPILIDEFLLKPYLLRPHLPSLVIENVPSFTTLIVAPLVIGWVLLVYWKK